MITIFTREHENCACAAIYLCVVVGWAGFAGDGGSGWHQPSWGGAPLLAPAPSRVDWAGIRSQQVRSFVSCSPSSSPTSGSMTCSTTVSAPVLPVAALVVAEAWKLEESFLCPILTLVSLMPTLRYFNCLVGCLFVIFCRVKLNFVYFYRNFLQSSAFWRRLLFIMIAQGAALARQMSTLRGKLMLWKQWNSTMVFHLMVSYECMVMVIAFYLFIMVTCGFSNLTFFYFQVVQWTFSSSRHRLMLRGEIQCQGMLSYALDFLCSICCHDLICHSKQHYLYFQFESWRRRGQWWHKQKPNGVRWHSARQGWSWRRWAQRTGPRGACQ